MLIPSAPQPRSFRLETDLRDAARIYMGGLEHAKVIKLHGGAYQENGLPDTLVVWHGLAVFFEWKLPQNDASKIQDLQLHRLRIAGAVGVVVESLEQVHQTLVILAEQRFTLLASGAAAWRIDTTGQLLEPRHAEDAANPVHFNEK